MPEVTEGAGKMGEGDQNVRTSIYKMSKSWDVMYIMVTLLTVCIVYFKVAEKVDIKHSYPKRKNL